LITDWRWCRTDEQITAETDPETKLKLRRFLRGLKNAHADVTKYRDFYSKFEYADESEYDSCMLTGLAGCHQKHRFWRVARHGNHAGVSCSTMQEPSSMNDALMIPNSQNSDTRHTVSLRTRLQAAL